MYDIATELICASHISAWPLDETKRLGAFVDKQVEGKQIHTDKLVKLEGEINSKNILGKNGMQGRKCLVSQNICLVSTLQI